MTPYDRLVQLAEREGELIAAARYDELGDLDTERTQLTRALPATPPPEARAALERAAALQEANSAALIGALGDTRREIVALDGHRLAARSYAPPAGTGALLDRKGA
jgi:hypothetical protein